MHDVDAKAAFTENPDGFLAAGFDGLSPQDLSDAVAFVAETLPTETARALTDPDADGDALARLAQVEPPPVDVPDDGPAAAFADAGLDEALDPEDDPGDEAEDDDEDDLDADPTRLDLEPDDHTAFEPLRADEGDAGLGVGFGNEDVDDVSPPDHGEPPDLDVHF